MKLNFVQIFRQSGLPICEGQRNIQSITEHNIAKCNVTIVQNLPIQTTNYTSMQQ